MFAFAAFLRPLSSSRPGPDTGEVPSLRTNPPLDSPAEIQEIDNRTLCDSPSMLLRSVFKPTCSSPRKQSIAHPWSESGFLSVGFKASPTPGQSLTLQRYHGAKVGKTNIGLKVGAPTGAAIVVVLICLIIYYCKHGCSRGPRTSERPDKSLAELTELND